MEEGRGLGVRVKKAPSKVLSQTFGAPEFRGLGSPAAPQYLDSFPVPSRAGLGTVKEERGGTWKDHFKSIQQG